MADAKLTELTAATSVALTDLFYAVLNPGTTPVSRKITVDNIGFAWLAGRSGGQTLKGDTASGGNLTLMSTNHATKGKLVLGASAFQETTNVFTLGTTTPPGGGSNGMVFSAGTILSSLPAGSAGITSKTIEGRARMVAVDEGGNVTDLHYADKFGHMLLLGGM